jgi:OmcA/MtrC family decaheme c-type cytochrome
MTTKMPSFMRFLVILSLLVSVGLLVGCSGDDGDTGPQGPQGPAGPQGEQGPPGEDGQDLTAVLEPESCSVCHAGVGDGHQAAYDDYSDASNLALEILGVKSVAAGGAFNVTMTIKITKNGQPFVDEDGLPALNQKRFYVTAYDSATRSFPMASNAGLNDSMTAVAGQPGVYEIKEANVPFAAEKTNALAYGYVADTVLDTEGMTLYGNVSNAGLAFGDADEYDSYANVEGCEKCHGSPYMKHGYRAAAVDGLSDFSACKVCHLDDRNGSHPDWQQIVDDPVGWGNGEDPDAVPQYAYKRNVMNDVHMSHAMEFPYPMSMANCATCHEGNIDKVTADEYMKPETCKSCHGIQSRPEEYDDLTFYAKRAPSMETIWEEEGVASLHNIDADCGACHKQGGFKPFSEMHSGYNSAIYDADGNRYTDLYSAEITSVSMADGKVDIRFTGNTELMTEPSVYVFFYGYDTKQAIVSNHSRDADRNRLGEYTIGGENPYFTEEEDSVQGNWHVTLDVSGYPEEANVLDMIENGVVKRLEVLIRPTVEVGGETVATNAVTQTLVIASNAMVDDFFKGDNAVVDIEGCNACHDALGTTFHSPDRGGDIVMCRSCHVPSSGGSHLEMQSREIAGYVHAIHSFQAFDVDEIDFTDNVEAKIYGLHIEHTFPNFTIKNCEACHEPGVYNVPDQTESLPAVLSDSESNDTWDRKIGYVPSYVVGPSSKACGGCHRAELINEDHASELTSFNQHTKQGGYLVEDGDWSEIVAEIMELFGQ